MNTYSLTFTSRCPVDDAAIVYSLEIRTRSTIKVETLLDATRAFERAFHEDIADQLHALFGGLQHLRAVHSGVTIKTERGLP